MHVLTDSLSGSRLCEQRRARGRCCGCVVVQAAVRAGELEFLHVADENNPADVLTKWLSLAKTMASDKYAVGISKAGSPGNEPERTGEPLVDAHVRHEQSADRELFRARVERGDRHVRRVAHVRKRPNLG